MEGRKENKYNLTGICPECGKLIKVEHTIAVDLVETGKTTETEGKDNDGRGNSEESKDSRPESADVRPADTKGPAGTESSTDQPTDPGKSKTNKRTGGGKAK